MMEKRRGRANAFERRLADNIDELKWLYMELYHGDTQAFDYFLKLLKEAYEARDKGLRALDNKREKNADWYRDPGTCGMQLYVQNFGGNLKEVMKHLPYIESCGVNYLHLMPFLKSPAGRSDGGYAVSDFRSVEPELGTIEDFRALTKRAHTHGINVCMDFVMNHTSEEHAWAKAAKAGDPEAQARYFFHDSWDVPRAYERSIPDVFPQTAPGSFTWCDEAGKVVMTMFYPYQWDLNYTNPTVLNDMTDNMLYLANCGVDVIRLDAVPYIWKRMGTDCRNQPEVHTIVRIMRLALTIVCPGTLMLGEVVMEPSKVVPYFGTVDKPECHMLYNVTTMATIWHTVATGDVRLLEHQLGTVFLLPRSYTFLNYLRCHDDIGWGLDYDYLKRYGFKETAHKKYLNAYFRGYTEGSDARGELYNDAPELGDARLCGTTASLCGIEAALYEKDDAKLDRGIRLDIMLHALLFTLPGVPVLYSGDEVGQLNDYTYHEELLKWDDSRYLHRGAFDFGKAAEREDETTPAGRIFGAIRSFEAERAGSGVFSDRADVWVQETGNMHVLGIGRYYEGKKVVSYFNFDGADQTVWLPDDVSDDDTATVGAHGHLRIYKSFS